MWPPADRNAPIPPNAPPAGAPEILVRLHEATLRLHDRPILPRTSWTIREGEHWAVVGPNGAGKTTLVRALTGEIPVVAGSIRPADPKRLRNQAARVSFEHGRALLGRAEAIADSRAFAGLPDAGPRVAEMLRPAARSLPREEIPAWVREISRLRERRLAELSSGELRRLQIALALSTAPRLLILDEPFEGVDAETRVSLAGVFGAWMTGERAIVWVTHRPEDLPAGITHLLAVRDGRVVFQGRAGERTLARLWRALYREPAAFVGPRVAAAASGPPGEVLIALQGIRLTHRGMPVFEDLSWTVRAGEHWAVVGPNGSGKSTLLRLLTGEHPQVYANRVELLGGRPGPGRSLSEHRRGIGWVSSELHLGYRRSATAEEVVLSGFFDSIGLYRETTAAQRAAARRRLEEPGALSLAERRLSHLSSGEQRLVLLARAIVKPPRVLILDEPCQGLDPVHRRRFLDAVDRAAASGRTALIYVSHREDELPGCITHRLRLARPAEGPTRAIVVEDRGEAQSGGMPRAATRGAKTRMGRVSRRRGRGRGFPG